jgi:hypothetical protein
MIRHVAATGLIVLFAAGAAAGDRAAADRCAASLPPVSKTMYDKALPAVLAGQSMEDALTAVVRPMVIWGPISVADARPAAEAAATCLKLAK